MKRNFLALTLNQERNAKAGTNVVAYGKRISISENFRQLTRIDLKVKHKEQPAKH
jgi:hypothetical protein